MDLWSTQRWWSCGAHKGNRAVEHPEVMEPWRSQRMGLESLWKSGGQPHVAQEGSPCATLNLSSFGQNLAEWGQGNLPRSHQLPALPLPGPPSPGTKWEWRGSCVSVNCVCQCAVLTQGHTGSPSIQEFWEMTKILQTGFQCFTAERGLITSPG